MKIRKGFTLIELIAVIVVLGVVLAITIPNVSKVVNNSYKEAYEIDLESLVGGAKSYILKKDIEIKPGIKTVVTLSEMKSVDAIDTILDPKTKEPCDGYVVITAGTTEYVFKPYLMCSTYISDDYGKDDLGLPVITLFGDSTVSIKTGEIYIDDGAMAYDQIDGDISDRIVVSASISPNKVGTYTVTYNVKDNNGNSAVPVTRTVYVVDQAAPTITMLGSSSITIEGGITYVDAGATALDDADGNITNKIVTTNTVNINQVGTYTVTYNVKDNSNNAAAPKVRTVNVVDTKPPVINAKGPSYTITEGDSNVISSSYFNISINGVLPLTSTACIDVTNSNTVVTNTSTLAPGTHTIKCIITKQNTLSADATVSLVVNPKFIGVPNNTYAPGGSLTYGGVEWLVVSDNGSNITLISKNNITTSAFGTSSTWAGSTANTYLNNTWLNSNSTLLSETQKGGIVYDAASASYVRLITKGELKASIANGSGTNFWTMTTSGGNLYYALSNAGTSYTKYTTTANANGTCYSGSNSALSSITSSYIANSVNITTAETIAAPTATDGEKATSYETVASGSCSSTYATGSTPYNYDCNCYNYSCGCSSYTCVKTSYYNVTYVAGSACTGSTCTGSACTRSTCSRSTCSASTCTGSVCGGSACAGSACTASTCIGSTYASNCAAYSTPCNNSSVCTSYSSTVCRGYSSVRNCSTVCDRYTSSYVCAGTKCAGSGCTRYTCTGSVCGGSACAGSACAGSACAGSACTGSACAGWNTSYGTSQASGTYNDTCTTCSSTCQSCSTCTGYTTTYSASTVDVNWGRYVASSQTSSMGIRAVITVKKK